LISVHTAHSPDFNHCFRSTDLRVGRSRRRTRAAQQYWTAASRTRGLYNPSDVYTRYAKVAAAQRTMPIVRNMSKPPQNILREKPLREGFGRTAVGCCLLEWNWPTDSEENLD
ncbi:hypothetical protein SARC_14012, partial [Sphaeroforma arctica JP610]